MRFMVGLGVLAACVTGGGAVLLGLGLGLQALALAPDIEPWGFLLALPLLTAWAWAVMRGLEAITSRLRRLRTRPARARD